MKRFLHSILSPLRSPLLLLMIALVYFISISNDITGDIGRIGQIIFSKEYRSQDKFNNLPMVSIDWCDTSNLKSNSVLFMGDSFTALTFYPDYLTNILQISSAKFFADNTASPEETFIALCNANIETPKVIFLESVERFFISRLCDLDFSSNILPKASVLSDVSVSKQVKEKQTDFSTFYKNQIIDNHAILKVSLRDSLFTCTRKENELYFYNYDLVCPNEEQIQTAISKLDSLFMLARERNICLFYVIAADKYDVYQEFAIDNTFPKKEVLEKFVEFESNPCFVNTKTVLMEKARQGVKDLYYADDTHWSPIGAQIVAEEIARHMDSLNVFQD